MHFLSSGPAGAAGCAVAALLKKGAKGMAGRGAVVVCCGGNISLPMLRGVLDKYGA